MYEGWTKNDVKLIWE